MSAGEISTGEAESFASQQKIRKLEKENANQRARLIKGGIERDALRVTIEYLSSLLSELTDSDDCWFDHHGGCQAHGFLSLQPGATCPHADSKKWALENRKGTKES